MRRYPDARALTAASLSEALALWSGLGYNRRCLALLETARLVAEAGAVPDDEAALLLLPGVGTYTARAVLAFAWDRPVALLETNVRAALLHEFFPGSERVSERALEEVSWRVLDRARPGEWYQALMDYGAELKKRGNPSRAAAVHRPQAKFEGSARQARGRALGVLAKSGPADAATLAFRSGLPCDRLHRALESLVADGLVVAENGSYGIAERKGNGKPEEG
jgi:A/G-specific adenine glycosylase